MTRFKYVVGQKVRMDKAPSWLAGRLATIIDRYSTHGGVVPQYHVRLARALPRRFGDQQQRVWVAYESWMRAE